MLHWKEAHGCFYRQQLLACKAWQAEQKPFIFTNKQNWSVPTEHDLVLEIQEPDGRYVTVAEAHIDGDIHHVKDNAISVFMEVLKVKRERIDRASSGLYQLLLNDKGGN